MTWFKCMGGSGSTGVDYQEAWIVANVHTNSIPTTTTHITYSNGSMSSFDIKSNAENTTVVMGDISSYIGSNSNWLWKVTATAAMKIRLFDVINQTLGEEQTVAANTDIITSGASTGDYCIEIRRYQ